MVWICVKVSSSDYILITLESLFFHL